MKLLPSILRDKSFLMKLKAIAIPVAIQNLIGFSVTAADTLMLGRVGEVQLSAAAVANQVTFTYMVITFGIAGGCGVLSAQFWGAGNKEKVREILAFMFRVVALFSLVVSAIAHFLPQYILGFIITDPEVIAEGVRYLRIMSIGYLISGVTMAGFGLLRSTGTVKIAVVASLCALLVSVTLNYGLIFGNFGFPALGIRGAAIATVIARVVEVTILAVYLFKIEQRIGFRLKNLLLRSEGIGRRFIRHGSPVLVNEVGWAMAHFFLGVIIGRMGREFVAANAIGGLMIQFVGIVIFGVSSATAAVIGNTIGAGEQEKARQYANGMLGVSFFLGILGFLAIQAIRLPLINFYELSDTARLYAQQITHIISVMVIFMSVAVISLLGTLRGGGDTRFAALVDIIFPWLIAIPLGFLVGPVLGWPVYLVYLVIRSEDIFKAIIVLWRVPRGKWLRDLTKSN